MTGRRARLYPDRELLVAMSIIAVLLIIAVPRYFKALEQSRETVLRQDLSVMLEAIDKHLGDYGQYPDSFAALLAAGPLARAQTGVTPEVTPAASASPGAAPSVDEAASYSIGLTFGSQMHGSGIEDMLSLDALIRGWKDGLAGKALGTQDRDRAMQMVRAGRDAAARAFLAKSGIVKGVVTTASGLQYAIIEPGDSKAASPTLDDRVTVHYRGRREALLLMKPGAQWRLFVPPALAHDANTTPAIPPGSLLIFDADLVQIVPQSILRDKDLKGKRVKAPTARAPHAETAAPVSSH
jgi:FKBP-type peptidyl-prolyl cis-trans isomerase/competence protein ComGC